jgi:hypothetical protein
MPECLVAGCLLNVALDPGSCTADSAAANGMAGIALATVVISVGGASSISDRHTPLWHGLTPQFPALGAAFRDMPAGLPAGLNMMTVALGIFVITWFVSRFSAKAAFMASPRVEQIILLPTIGLNIATLTLCGRISVPAAWIVSGEPVHGGSVRAHLMTLGRDPDDRRRPLVRFLPRRRGGGAGTHLLWVAALTLGLCHSLSDRLLCRD